MLLLPAYAAFAAAFLFYVLIPVIGGFLLRSQWRRFRDRVAMLGVAPRLRYADLSAASRQGRTEIGSYRLSGTIEALEGENRVWVRGHGVSALVDLSRAPLYVLSSGFAEAGSLQRMRWSSVSSLVEGTSIFVAGLLVFERGHPVFVDKPEEALIAVCHDKGEERLLSRIIAAGRAPNEYWNYPTRISIALGLVAVSIILLLFRNSIFSTVQALIFLVGASPVLPFAPPGLAFFIIYHRLWRRALSSRTERDLMRLPLRYASEPSPSYVRRYLEIGESPPSGSAILGASRTNIDSTTGTRPIVFLPISAEDSDGESFVVAGDPGILARKADRDAVILVTASGIAFALAILVNYIIAFIIWRSVL